MTFYNFFFIFIDNFRLLDGEFAPSEEFPEGGPANMRDLETAPFLRIQVERIIKVKVLKSIIHL